MEKQNKKQIMSFIVASELLGFAYIAVDVKDYYTLHVSELTSQNRTERVYKNRTELPESKPTADRYLCMGFYSDFNCIFVYLLFTYVVT